MQDFAKSLIDLSVLCIDSEGSTEAEGMKNLCALSGNPESRLMLFPGGGHGFYQIPEAHDVALQWLVDKLGVH